MTFKTVKNGDGLDKIELISFDSLFNVWVKNRDVQKLDINTHQLNSEKTFTYFGKYKIGLFTSTPYFFKVYSDTLSTEFPNYNDFYGFDLKMYLQNKIIPADDKKYLNESTCQKKPKYKFTLADKKVILTLTWDVQNCNDLIYLKDKKYKAVYNLTTKQYEN